jgi:hypothetical protein
VIAMLPIQDWHDFYLATGAGAAAILGATFIVATLLSNARQRTIGLKGFVTPSAVHLASVFAGSAVLLMPTLSVVEAVAVFLLGGLAGVVYCGIVWTRIRNLPVDLSDRFWYAALPALCYAAFFVGAVEIWLDAMLGFEMLGIVFILLVIVGIRNAWDMATFMITWEERNPPSP